MAANLDHLIEWAINHIGLLGDEGESGQFLRAFYLGVGECASEWFDIWLKMAFDLGGKPCIYERWGLWNAITLCWRSGVAVLCNAHACIFSLFAHFQARIVTCFPRCIPPILPFISLKRLGD